MGKGMKRALKEAEAAAAEEIEEEEDGRMELEAAKAIMEEQHSARREAAAAAAAAASSAGSSRPASFNKAALEAKTRELDRGLPWPETMVICEHPLEVADIHDDLGREVAFYNHAMAAVSDAKVRLAQLGIPYRRPDDYLCEMVKSDAHMAKIKDKLIFEQKKMEAFEQRKQRQEQRKYAKQAGAVKAKERSEKKKEALQAIDQWRRDAKGRGGPLPDDDGLDAVMNSNGKRSRDSSGGGRDGGGGDTRKKRAAYDKKYGFGGAKRYAKSTDNKSLNDFSGFDPKKGKLTPRKGKKGGGKPNAGANRPGKAARQQKRSGKR